MVMVWLLELPPIPATMGTRAAKATSLDGTLEGADDREATKAVTRLMASQDQRFFTKSQNREAKMSSFLPPVWASCSLSASSRITSNGVPPSPARPASRPDRRPEPETRS